MTDVGAALMHSQLTETAKAGSTFYNKVTKQRSYYLCPIKQGCVPFHIWGNLVERAGYKLSDARRKPGMRSGISSADASQTASQWLCRKLYALGLQITTVGPNDGNGLFSHFPDRQWRPGYRDARRQTAHR